ncbi:MAG TPA: cytochrome c [Terriglobales bacterium]|nr:cytochrome c [Terriglobales bacterium]
MRKCALGFIAGILVLPIAAVVTAWLGLLPTVAITDPPRWEVAFAQLALNSYIVRHAPHVRNPIAPTDQNLLAGLAVFRDACAGCHGDSNGTSDYGVSFYPRVPQFAARPPPLPDWQLFWIVKNGVRYSGMSAWDGQWHHDKTTSDDRMWKVVTFLSRLNSLPPAVDAEWHKKPVQ